MAQLIRQRVNYVTLVNPTGFREDGAEGLNKITTYYEEWLRFLEGLKHLDMTIVFDRFFFSEMVFSQVCKSYDFEKYYQGFVDVLKAFEDVNLVYMYCTESQDIEEMSNRTKVKFKDVGDSQDEVDQLKRLYDAMFNQLEGKLKVHKYDRSGKTVEQNLEQVAQIAGLTIG